MHTPILSFTYPDTVAKQAKQRIADRKAKKADEARRAAAARKREATLQRNGVEAAYGLKEASKLDFGFRRVTGNTPFRPVRIYSDGKKTYIDLKPFYNAPLSALVPGRSEENKVLNTRVEAGGTRLVADRVIRDSGGPADDATRCVDLMRRGAEPSPGRLHHGRPRRRHLERPVQRRRPVPSATIWRAPSTIPCRCGAL